MTEDKESAEVIEYNRKQRKAMEKHKVKGDEYRAKKLDEISRKVNLGVIQVVESMKKQPWCSRLEICFEVLFRRANPNYNEVGEWVGPEEDRDRSPWCVRLRQALSIARMIKSLKDRFYG